MPSPIIRKQLWQLSCLLLVSIPIVTSENCSTYDPCGQYGYCVDNSDGDWQCTCKFWWNGTLCNEQTSSGIQVITLGALLGVLILVFYGLGIFCSIRKKKLNPEEKKPEVERTDGQQPTLANTALTNVKQSARCSSCLIGILMVIVAVLALITKWLLLQPIHDEIVRKYQNSDLLFYQRNSFCDLVDTQEFNLITFPAACLVILIFTVFSRRTSFMRNKCQGRIGPVIPLDFYVHIKRTFAAVVFAIISDELLDIINQVINGNTSNGEGVVVLYLIRIAKVLVIGMRYYPVLSAVYMDSILALLCATLYAWLDFSLAIVYQGWCQSDFYPSEDNFDDTNGTDIARLLQFYGTGSNLIVIQLCGDIPRYVCWSYIVIKLPSLLIKRIYRTTKREGGNGLRLTREEKILLHSSAPHSVEMSYVRNLFRLKEHRSNSRYFIGRLLPKFVYEWRDDFRFSSRVISLYASVILLLFFVTMQACVLGVPLLKEYQRDIQDLLDALTSIGDSVGKSEEFPLPDLSRPFVFAILTALLITVIQVLVLLANIRRNLFQLYRGDYSEVPRRDASNYVNYGTGNFHFAGFFIGYLIWGYVLIAVFLLLIYVSIDAFITFGSVRFLENILKKVIPIVLLIFFKQYLNKLLARYVFLQQYGDVLAINNRRVLMIFLYFNFFLDAFLGFISSIVRIIKSIIGGFLYMCRLDYSPLGRKLEVMDAGFSAYCGFIHLEAVHRNPIMLAVASHLYGRMKAKQQLDLDGVAKKVKGNGYSSRAIRRWHLAVLMTKNPALVFRRKKALAQAVTVKAKILEKQIKRLSCIAQMSRRPSLVSEIDLQNMWERKS